MVEEKREPISGYSDLLRGLTLGRSYPVGGFTGVRPKHSYTHIPSISPPQINVIKKTFKAVNILKEANHSAVFPQVSRTE